MPGRSVVEVWAREYGYLMGWSRTLAGGVELAV
jgi:hypothetical protein